MIFHAPWKKCEIFNGTKDDDIVIHTHGRYWIKTYLETPHGTLHKFPPPFAHQVQRQVGWVEAVRFLRRLAALPDEELARLTDQAWAEVKEGAKGVPGV